jgi:glycosyltransferase involved in cell wall biosynthesis
MDTFNEKGDTLSKPILIISDAPSCTSGLGRITRDLATRIATDPDMKKEGIRIATAGYGGPGNKSFPFHEYHFNGIEGWQLPELPIIAEDFAAGEELVLWWIWDASRIGWVARETESAYPFVSSWMKEAKVKKWIYAPVDAYGPNGTLSHKLSANLKAFDRVLNYTPFSAAVTGYHDFIPHGIDTSVFHPRDKKEARDRLISSGFPAGRDSTVIGIVATNQNRKDWGRAFDTISYLIHDGMDIRVWCHTDVIERYWSIPNLVEDFGLQGKVAITTSNFSDEQMSWMYSACDLTLGIGLGEGFGYPIFESMACGVPCVHGDYAGAAGFLPGEYLVTPNGWRWEGPFCNRRPNYSSSVWANVIRRALGTKHLAILPRGLDWAGPELWPKWKEWILKGVK